MKWRAAGQGVRGRPAEDRNTKFGVVKMKKKIEAMDTREVLGKSLTIYGTVEEPLFLAKDVAEWIDYAKTGKGAYDVSRMLDTVDADEKTTRISFVSGQNRECLFLTEDGLYEVLMQSQKPIAKVFKKEVKRILKEYRRNGVVISPKVAMSSTEDQMESFRRALDAAVHHALEMAKERYLPEIERLTKEKSWISTSREAKAMATASRQYRKVRQLEKELETAKDELEEMLPDATAHRMWRSAYEEGMRKYYDGLEDPMQTRLFEE